jgi:D-tyrosyl-tRNA(Tyr) deacylase
MRALVQRVNWAKVEIDGVVTGEIGPGLCALIGVTHTDTEATADKLAQRLWNLRIFDDEGGFMNRPVAEAGGAVLVVSQFTLYGDTSRGRRPSWVAAARPEQAEPLVARVELTLAGLGATVARGRFGAHMHLSLCNDGPVTVTVDA